MVVQHNLRAMNSNRMLGLTANVQSKSTEKLSSGYKINRAADDAAGLSISEKMRKQIRGLSQASLNAQDGISAVQTAEGALNEVQDMLQRMNELAVKASNGTMSENDRNYIQDEIDQLVTEIDRVAETTKFNETYLLKGDEATREVTKEVTPAEAAVVFKVEYTTEPTTSIVFDDAANFGTSYFVGGEGTALTTANALDYVELDENDAIKLKDGVEIYSVAADTTGQYGDQLDGVRDDANFLAEFKTATTGLRSAANATDAAAANNLTNDELTALFDEDGTMATGTQLWKQDNNGDWVEVGAEQIGDFVTITKAKDAVDATTETEEETYNTGVLNFKLHVGADSTDNNQITVDIKAMDAASLGLRSDTVTDAEGNVVNDEEGNPKKTLLVNGKTDENARDAIDVIADAIQKVSEQRSALGAVQNRLEHTIANLDNVVENTTAAESQIRDTDMATEMVKYSNNNILAQAGQAMLAQANQANQGVLSLLG